MNRTFVEIIKVGSERILAAAWVPWVRNGPRALNPGKADGCLQIVVRFSTVEVVSFALVAKKKLDMDVGEGKGLIAHASSRASAAHAGMRLQEGLGSDWGKPVAKRST